MLESKKPIHEFNYSSIPNQNLQKPDQLHIKKCNSQDLIQTLFPPLDLNVDQEQQFVCFQCAHQNLSEICNQCKGTGLLKATHPLVQLMNDIFNAKFIPPSSQLNKKDFISTKTSSNSNFSDSLQSSQKINNSIQRNSTKSRQSKQKQTQKGSILDFLLTPLQTIIKQESTLDEKCKKCNICQYQFDSVKYTCGQCQNYNVCESCYQTKRINHCHQLKKIQSISSQKTGQNDQSQIEQLKLQKHQNPTNQQHQFTHSDVDKLSLKSDQQVELMFNRLKTKQQKTQSDFNGQGINFFKLHQVQQEHNNQQLCNSCKIKIQDCYWICETCKSHGQSFQLCKDCYDHEMYQHPKQHNLGLNFFTLDQNFFTPDLVFFDHIREDIYNDQKREEFKIQQKQKKKFQPLSSISMRENSKLTSTTSYTQMSKIGVIGHRDIFTGFHKQVQNQHYKNEIISPIPRSIKLPHSFKDKNQKQQNMNNFANQDAEIIVELMNSSVNTTPKKSIKIQRNSLKPNKQNLNDQSRVQFDENMIMDLGLSQDYNLDTPNQPKTPQQLYKSQNRYRGSKQVKKREKFTNLFPNMTLQQINPQTSILQINQQQDYYFTGYFCDICGQTPIKNIKYHCLECQQYDLCQNCFLHKRVEQHWHDHFRKDDGRLKSKKILQHKQKIIKKAIIDLSRSLSPSRRSLFYLK